MTSRFTTAKITTDFFKTKNSLQDEHSSYQTFTLLLYLPKKRRMKNIQIMHTKAKNTKKKLFLKEKTGQQWGRNRRTTYTHARSNVHTDIQRKSTVTRGN